MLVVEPDKAVLWALWQLHQREEGRKSFTTKEVADLLPELDVGEVELNIRFLTEEGGGWPLIDQVGCDEWKVRQVGAMLAEQLEMPPGRN